MDPERDGFFQLTLSAHPNATLTLASHRGLRVRTTTYNQGGEDVRHNVDVGPTSGRSSSSQGDHGHATLVLRGTLTDINHAVQVVTVTPCAHYNGLTSLTVLADDLGNTGGPSVLGGGGNGGGGGGGGATRYSGTTDVVVIPIRVVPLNDRPQFELPVGTIVCAEDQAVVIPNVRVYDPDSVVIANPVLLGSTLMSRCG